MNSNFIKNINIPIYKNLIDNNNNLQLNILNNYQQENNSNLENIKNENTFYMYDNDNNIFCLNCGKKGHIIKKCLQPIISIGIICIKFKINLNMNDIINYSKKIQNNYLFSIDEINRLEKIKKIILNIDFNNFDKIIEYLFIRRKNSLNYIEFMRGKYELDNITYLENILNLISKDEKELLLKNDFQYLWNNLWEFNKKNNNSNEFKNSEYKFNILKKGYYTKKNEINIFVNLESIINNSNKIFQYEEPEWGFPKGRRNLKEKNIECAKREFEEETNLLSTDYHILNMNPLDEIYLSTNYSKYKHIYYIAQYDNINKNLELNLENISQKVEIGAIDWYKFEEGFQKVRNYNIEKKNTLYNLHNTLKLTLFNFKEILNKLFEKI